MSTPASDAIRTRSGLIINRSSQGHKPLLQSVDRSSSSPKIKKAKRERGKSEKKVAKLDKPLSELTKDWEHVPVVDIDAYVNRSAELRRKEVEDGRMPGRVKRPMNSFMLYRKAYQNRCKHWCLQNNHQVVSQVCGDSWPLEPDSIRQQFNEWARIERVNHQNAHPGYKFSPSKTGNSKSTGKRKAPEDVVSEESDLDDYDWEREHSKRKKPSNRRSRVSENTSYSTIRSPYDFSRDVSEEPSYNSYNRSSYQITNPGKQAPAPYSYSNLDNGQYYQQIVHQHSLIPGVEDVVIKKTATPGMHYLGLPSGHGLVSPYHSQEGALTPEYKIDPSLIDHDPAMYDNKFNTQEGMYLGDGFGGGIHWQDQYVMGEQFDYLSAPHSVEHLQVHEQHLQIFKGNHEDWQIETLDAGQEFDKWMDDNKETVS
jgi:HMG (high mobility group) box